MLFVVVGASYIYKIIFALLVRYIDMTKHIYILLATIVFVMPSLSWAESDVDRQLEELQLKLQQLEARIKTLETAAVKADIVERNESEALESVSPWIQIKLGLSHTKVVELLGKPVSTRKGAMDEYWYYSDTGREGPYVKFMFLQVDSWRAPE